MPRATGASVVKRRRRKKVLKATKGFWGGKSRQYRRAKEAMLRAGAYAYRDRKVRKRDFRSLWIVRINAACRQNDISYSRFIDGLTKAGVLLNRKVLAQIAVHFPQDFIQLTEVARQSLN